MSGKLYWAKIFGPPRLNYNGDGKEWTFEFEPDKDGVAILKEQKLLDRLKNKHDDRPAYLVLKKKELDADGKPNDPIRVYGPDNETWDSKVLIGNGTSAQVKLDIRDYGPGKKKGVYPTAIKVMELVEYKQTDFPETPAAVSGAKGKKDDFKKDFGLDADVLE